MFIKVINTLPVPSGEASVNRLLSYSKGLANLGNDVSILSSGYLPSSTNPSLIDGVKVSNYGKRMAKPFSLISALCSISKALFKDKTDVIILVSNSLLLIWPLFFTGLFFLAFTGLVTVLLSFIEKKPNYKKRHPFNFVSHKNQSQTNRPN